MAKGISIGVASDTKDFSEGIASGVVKPLEDAQTTITELADTSDAASARIEAALKAQQVATTQVAASHKAATQTVVEESEQQTEAVELSANEQNRIQKESVKTGAAAVANVVENSASALSDISGDAVTTIGNILATISAVGGPEVAVVAGIGAAAFGLISGALQRSEADAKHFATEVAADTAALEKLGKAGIEGPDAVNAKLASLSQTADENGQTLDGLTKSANAAGVSAIDTAQAYAGNIPVLDELLPKLRAQSDELARQARIASDSNSATHDQYDSLINQETATNSLVKTLQTQKDAYDASVKGGDELTKTQENGAAAAKAAAAAQKAWADTVKNVMDGVGGSLKKGSDSFKDFLKDNEKALEDQAQETRNIEIIYSRYGTTAGAALVSSLQSSSNPGKLLSEAATATPADIATYQAQYENYGKLGAVKLTKGVEEGLPSSIPLPVVPYLNTKAIDAQIKKLQSTPIPVTVVAKSKDRNLL